MCVCVILVAVEVVWLYSHFSQNSWLSINEFVPRWHFSLTTDSNRLPALHKCFGVHVLDVPVQQSTSRRRKVFISSVPFARHRVMHPLLSKRSNPCPTCRGFPLCPQPALPGHRRLRARATVRMIPASIRKGSQVFRKPAQLDQTEDTEKWGEEHGGGDVQERNRR